MTRDKIAGFKDKCIYEKTKTKTVQEAKLATNPLHLLCSHGIRIMLPLFAHSPRVQEIEGGERPCSGAVVLLHRENNAMQETKGGDHHLEMKGELLSESERFSHLFKP